MLIRLGYELIYQFEQATPMILNLNVHYSRSQDLVRADTIVMDPAVPLSVYRDGFRNWCTRAVAPAGRFDRSPHVVLRTRPFRTLSSTPWNPCPPKPWCTCCPADIARPSSSLPQ